VGILGGLLLYTAGWMLEDTVYWLRTEAVALWAVALPSWLCMTAFTWRPRWGEWLIGFALSVPIFIVHLGLMWSVRDHLNDDYIGISAGFAVAALVGWVVGRLLHALVRRSRARGGV
jgi:hypothetical protein